MTQLIASLTPLTVASLVALIVALSPRAAAQTPSSPALTAALKEGGLVLVMRHASSPRELPAADVAQPDNPTRERQLDAAGRQGATAMGEAWRRLGVPVNEVLSSPTFRARETVKYAQLAPVKVVEELGDGGHSMQGVTTEQAVWLRSAAARRPARGNTVLVTHQPNLAAAFPDWGSTVADGETVVLRPDDRGNVTVVGRVKIGEWPALR